MKEFIGQFPDIVISCLALTLAIIGWSVRQAVLNLNETMKNIAVNHGLLNNRVIILETICKHWNHTCQTEHHGRNSEG